jgi:hypothetical protein
LAAHTSALTVAKGRILSEVNRDQLEVVDHP